MVFDVVFAVQHYVLYPSSGRGEHGGAVEVSGEEDSESLLYASAAANGSKDNPRSP
jgi:hypothetical protein